MKTFSFNKRIIAGLVIALILAFSMISCNKKEPCEPCMKPLPGLVKAKLQPVFYGYNSGAWLGLPAASTVVDYVDPMYSVGDIIAPEGDLNGVFYRIIEKDTVLTK